MIDVYSWATPNGHKVHIMLEETSLKHRIHGVNIRTGDQFKPEFLKISPNNRIPAIVDHDGPTASRCRCSSRVRSCCISPPSPASFCPTTCTSAGSACSG